MIGYKLVDVPELGYFGTVSLPRGELLVGRKPVPRLPADNAPPRCSTPTASPDRDIMAK